MILFRQQSDVGTQINKARQYPAGFGEAVLKDRTSSGSLQPSSRKSCPSVREARPQDRNVLPERNEAFTCQNVAQLRDCQIVELFTQRRKRNFVRGLQRTKRPPGDRNGRHDRRKLHASGGTGGQSRKWNGDGKINAIDRHRVGEQIPEAWAVKQAHQSEHERRRLLLIRSQATIAKAISLCSAKSAMTRPSKRVASAESSIPGW